MIYNPGHAPEGTARDSHSGPRPLPECLAAATPNTGAASMHPADLATHRAQRERQAHRAIERDLARLLTLLDGEGRYEARKLVDAGRAGCLPLEEAHSLIRARISQLDREDARAA